MEETTGWHSGENYTWGLGSERGLFRAAPKNIFSFGSMTGNSSTSLRYHTQPEYSRAAIVVGTGV